MNASIKKYFAGGNTSKGFYSLYDSALEGLERIFIIKGGPGTGKSTLMRNISIELSERGHDVEHLHCSSDPNSLDGVIVRDLSIGIVDGTAPHVIEPKNPGIVEEIVNLGDCWNRDILAPNKLEITKISSLIQMEFIKAYEKFAKAKDVYDEYQKYYLANIDYKKADDLTQQLIKEIFKDHNPPFIREMFLGAYTSEGFVEYVGNLTKSIEKRYIVKGCPGSGKSRLMENVFQTVKEMRFDVEVYRCSFEPSCISMIIIPKLNVAIIDEGTSSLRIEERKNDNIIDLSAGLHHDALIGLEQKIVKLKEKYQEYVNNGIDHISKAKQLHQEKEKYYIQAMDFEKVNDKRIAILKEILM